VALLGDSFPENIQRKFADTRIKPGSVVKFEVPDTIPPKIKYFIILGADGDNIMVATVFINSHINPNIFTSEKLKKLHYKLEVVNYNFLEYDSYVDCSDVRERKIENIKNEILNNPAVHQGDLLREDFTNIRKIIKETKKN
jgi:hypothetical protein